MDQYPDIDSGSDADQLISNIGSLGMKMESKMGLEG